MNVQVPAPGQGAAPPAGQQAPAVPAAAQPVAQPAPPVQQPAAPVPFAQQPPGPATYIDFYNDASNDPYNGNYLNAFQTYHVPLANAGVIQPADLANQV